MAGIPVNNNLNALMNPVNQTANVPDGPSTFYAKQEALVKDSFDMVMNRINSQVNKQMDVQVSGAAGSKMMSANIVTTDFSRHSTTADSVTASGKQAEVKNDTAGATQENTVGESVSDSQEKAVTKTGEELVEEVAKEMDVTVEEVEEAMAILGLSAVELLNPDNMKQLLLVLSGNEDQLAIITDGELYGHLQNLLQTVSETLDALQSQLGLSEEELNVLLADLAVAEEGPEDLGIVGEEIISGELFTETEVSGDDVNLEGAKDYAVTVHKDGETVEVKVTVDDASGDKSVQEEVTAVQEKQTQHDAKSGNRNTSGENKGEGNAAGNLNMQTPLQQMDVNDIAQQQPVAERFVSTEDIMNQIMEYMKINLKGDVQEMELQLHPASLGNVNVQIAAKDGVITAQFTAQNEVVKAAIESQLVQLKTQFEEQGIKVDAVEVTVADYRFEQSFSGGEEHTGEGRSSGKKSRRRINLSEIDLEELPEDMDDSERIAAEMMAESGNTVDYTV